MTVLQIGFKGWYCNWLLIIKKRAVKIMLPGWWWVTILSYPGTRLWEQMVPVTISELWRIGWQRSYLQTWGRIMTAIMKDWQCITWAERHSYVISFNPYNNLRESILLSPFYEWRKWCSQVEDSHVIIPLHLMGVWSFWLKSLNLSCYLHSLQWKSAKWAL